MRASALLARGLLLLSLCLAPGESAAADSASPAGAAVYVENQIQPGRLAIKPHGYYSHISVHNLTWSGWGQPQAVAKGTFTFQFCVQESCAVSPFYDEPVTVTLSGLKRCRARLSYTTLALSIEGPLPDSSFKTYRTSVASCRPSRRGAH